MSRLWNKKGYRPSFVLLDVDVFVCRVFIMLKAVRAGKVVEYKESGRRVGGGSSERKDAKEKQPMIIDVSEEPDPQRKRLKSLRKKRWKLNSLGIRLRRKTLESAGTTMEGEKGKEKEEVGVDKVRDPLGGDKDVTGNVQAGKKRATDAIMTDSRTKLVAEEDKQCSLTRVKLTYPPINPDVY
ncbi:hypothetical protein L1987_77892 [Smallanthus sonchifolius]|uniref:Uncharacterized protein n=1 Tax=Smallanthus sonchifolius TaxID=185202 RepID=A0ACB8ZB66_9ASTR|nr:hypothetical protein L1987_77892 [Smallanthus sonchifolius]